MNQLALWPQTASTEADKVDLIFIFLLVLSAVIVLLVGGLLIGFAVRYRRGSAAPRGALPEFLSRDIEIGWTSATFFLALFLFWWAGTVELSAVRPPADALDIHVLGKQWMWEARHPSGAREINELHVPLGQPVRLMLTSQDVIHGFFVPAFRIKQDAVPGRLTQTWFTATETGRFELFCSQFCGTNHSVMGGTVIVMKPEDYAVWSRAQPEADDLAKEGGKLFVSLGCSACHAESSRVHAPRLAGLFGSPVQLSDGHRIKADEAYLRDSILFPDKDVVAGYNPIMPSFRGVVGEDDLQRLVAYLMSLRSAALPPGGTP